MLIIGRLVVERLVIDVASSAMWTFFFPFADDV